MPLVLLDAPLSRLLRLPASERGAGGRASPLRSPHAHRLITVPWGERLGGAEAMLQGVLEGAGEGEHELEVVFFERRAVGG